MYMNKKKIIIWSKFELNFNNDRIDVTIATIAKFSSFNPSSFVNTFIFILLFFFFFWKWPQFKNKSPPQLFHLIPPSPYNILYSPELS